MSSPGGTDLTREQADALVRSRGFTVLLAVAAVIGVLVSLVAWCFLEAVHWVQEEAYVHLPHAFGYADGPPTWWPLPVLALTGVLVAAAITRLPGEGGHVPVHGLSASGPANPAELPGIVLAALASLGLGVVLGPEAPLIALGSAVGILATRFVAVDERAHIVLGTAGSFSAISALFGGPIVAGIMLVESGVEAGRRLLSKSD